VEEQEITIGRNGDYKVPKEYEFVSSLHARLIRNDKGIYIEDQSRNGTFVNSVRIQRKKINKSDVIMLGGENYYRLNLEKALKLLPMTQQEFQEAFLRLKKAYEDFQTESSNLIAKGQEDMMTKRMLPTMLLGSITGLLALLVGDNASVKIFIAVVGGILSVVVFLVATKMASTSSKNNREKLNKLTEKFELDYICPACGGSFKGRSWEFLNRGGRCPFQHCKFHQIDFGGSIIKGN